MSDNYCPTCKANPVIGDGYCPTCHRTGKLDEWVKSLPPYQPKPMTGRNEEAPITTVKVQS